MARHQQRHCLLRVLLRFVPIWVVEGEGLCKGSLIEIWKFGLDFPAVFVLLSLSFATPLFLLGRLLLQFLHVESLWPIKRIPNVVLEGLNTLQSAAVVAA